MATIVLRTVKGSALTWQEADDNFSNLNSEVAGKLDITNYTAADVFGKVLTLSGGGTVNFLRADGTWTLPVPGNGTGNTQILYNNAGNFGSSANLTYNGSTLSLAGDASISGTGKYLRGDWSAAGADRMALQSNITNGITAVPITPNGTATASYMLVYNASDRNNAAYGTFGITPASVLINANAAGSGSFLPIDFLTSGLIRMQITAAGPTIFTSSVSAPRFGTTEYDAGTSGTSKTIDWANGGNQKLSLTGNVTLTFSNPLAGMNVTLKCTQDGVGGRTITWPTIKWQNSTTPTMTATIGRTDLFFIYYDGTTYWGRASQNYT